MSGKPNPATSPLLNIRAILTCGFLTLIACSQGVSAQSAPSQDLSEGLEEAMVMCDGLTEQNKGLASAAGYDIDKLCATLGLLDAEALGAADDSDTLVFPREPFSNSHKRDGEDGDNTVDPLEEKRTLEEEARAQQRQNRFTSSELKPFGYELFAGEPTTFEPASRIPVSPDYLLGPGDTIEVLFFGSDNKSYSLPVGRNGAVDFPNLGPIVVAGMSFSDAKMMLHQRISEQMLGVEASITLGELRSIQVFILGEAYKPGSYTISSLSTITNALFVSGGLNDIASLRNIMLKRGGKVIAHLDLYDLLLHGDTDADKRLQSGDVIHIPSVKKTASVSGEVRRPAIYELKDEISAKQLVELAGGLLPKAYASGATISRIGNSGFMSVVDVDLTSKKGRKIAINNGDLLTISSVAEYKELVVSVQGHVHHPAEFLWQPNLRISDIVKSTKQLKPNADLGFALIRREIPPIGQLQPLFVSLGAALANPGSEADLVLLPRDQLQIFSQAEGRQLDVEELVAELKEQSRFGAMASVVSVVGKVKSPGEYPLTENMTLTQLIAAAGGLKEEAYIQQVELSRYHFGEAGEAFVRHQTVNLEQAYVSVGREGDPKLSPYDKVFVRAIPEFRENLEITLQGEVAFPGVYSFARGEKLSEVIERAGGLTRLAYPKAAVFTRVSLRLQEQKQLEELKGRLKADIAAAGIERVNEGKSSELSDAQTLLDELSSAEALGRLVIGLPEVLEGILDDVALKNGDVLVIPQYRQEITVLGEVQQPTAHLYRQSLKIYDYIDLSGGTNSRADRKRIYVVKADGSVVLPRRSAWFSRRQVNIEPGDTVVVPLDVDRKDGLAVWAEASQIIYQLALGAAAVSNLK